MQKVKIAILGCGKQAAKHISGLLKCKNVDIVLMDQCEQTARDLAEKYELKYVLTPEEVFQDESISGISICTPTPSHYEIICQSIASEKHFLCEKPLTETIGQAQDIDEKLSQSSLIGAVGYIYRQAPVFKKVKEILEYDNKSTDVKVLGNIHNAMFRIGGRGSHATWKHRKETGGGAIKEMLVHQLDLANWLFGEIQEFELLDRQLKQFEREIQGKFCKVDAEDFVLLKVKYTSGVDVYIWADMLTPSFYQSIECMGPNGNLAASIVASFDSFVFTQQETNIVPIGRTPFSFEAINLFESQMSDFIEAIRTGAKNQLPSVADSIKVQRVVDAISIGA